MGPEALNGQRACELVVDVREAAWRIHQRAPYIQAEDMRDFVRTLKRAAEELERLLKRGESNALEDMLRTIVRAEFRRYASGEASGPTADVKNDRL